MNGLPLPIKEELSKKSTKELLERKRSMDHMSESFAKNGLFLSTDHYQRIKDLEELINQSKLKDLITGMPT